MTGGLVLLMIGDELLDGRSRDTNSEWIIERTRSEGWRIAAIEVIEDRAEPISQALLRHVGQASAILVSGGLGPTQDDVTRDGLALAMGQELEFDAEIFRHIEALFLSRRREMPASNRRQAMRPRATEVIANRAGSAVGLWAELDGTPIVLLPGVPGELRTMFTDAVQARLARSLDHTAPPAHRLRTSQIAESRLVDFVNEALPDAERLDLAYCVSEWGVDLLVRDRDPDRLDRHLHALRERLGESLYGENDATLPEAVIAALGARTVAVAESCTGGLVGAAITSVPGSSKVFLGGTLAYANAVKQQELAVPEALLRSDGAVSESVAAAMASGVRLRYGADFGISTTGIAGPGGGTPDKPVGTVCVGLCGPDGVAVARTLRFGGDRALVRRWSVAAALDDLRRAAAGQAP